VGVVHLVGVDGRQHLPFEIPDEDHRVTGGRHDKLSCGGEEGSDESPEQSPDQMSLSTETMVRPHCPKHPCTPSGPQVTADKDCAQEDGSSGLLGEHRTMFSWPHQG
jgi:hypothetical protein